MRHDHPIVYGVPYRDCDDCRADFGEHYERLVALEGWDAAIRRLPLVVESLGRKIIDGNPTWQQLPELLTDEERDVFFALLSLRSPGEPRP